MQMMKMRKSFKFLFAAMAVFLLFSFFFVLFHHHADGQEHADCIICRLTQQIVGFFVLTIAALIGLSQSSKRFFVVSIHNFVSLLFSSKLQNRAPPVLA